MTALKNRPPSGTSPTPRSAGGGTFRTFGRRRMSKLRQRVILIAYLALGCLIPYYLMMNAEQEPVQRDLGSSQQQDRPLPAFGENANQEPNERSVVMDENNPRGYRRRKFFHDMGDTQLLIPPLQDPPHQQQPNPESHQTRSLLHQPQHQHETEDSPAPSDPLSTHMQVFYQGQQSIQKDIVGNLTETLALHRRKPRLSSVRSHQKYTSLIQKAQQDSRNMAYTRISDEPQFETSIPGTRLNTIGKTKRFQQLMDQALNKGRWIYEPDRDYPDFGGAIAWNKKMKNERDRDVAIDRPHFPEAGKYHWEPIMDILSPLSTGQANPDSQSGPRTGATSWATKGWHANRIQRDDFCAVLGPRYLVLVGDLIHWQLHDSIMYNMFDTPQLCYGDLSCHLGAGHPLCPSPNDVQMKFIRNDLLSPVRASKNRSNETRTHDPVEMPWLRDTRNKGTVILGASHQTMPDKVFMRRLTNTMIKIRKARPDTLIIYRNNPVGHPECPCKANGLNSDRDQGSPTDQANNDDVSSQRSIKRRKLFTHNKSTFAAVARPFEQDIPLAEMLDYPLNWVHYDRQNQIAKEIIEAVVGIYWNVTTMANMRPDGHVGGQDCLSYKRPGSTDEWAVSLYNLFKTIDLVEQESQPDI
ncbi:MAG: hypothetical protein J3Q66DRAFT_409919 [Benniella sp.]|nr:MAG: hypothetical protein J3Q66DRAFT_409919 [Benniella sp.]